MFKRIAKSAFAAKIASFAIGVYMRLVYKTSRWRFINLDRLRAAEAEGRGVVLAFWHGRMMMIGPARNMTEKQVYMLISTHRDGEIIANAVGGFGVKFIRGSAANPKKKDKNKSGAPAITQMLAALKDGEIVGVTPDGPRGPGERAKFGVVRLAHMAGAPIIPVAYSTSRGKQLGTWDKFLLAAPFSQGYYVVGAPIRVSPDARPGDFEAVRQELETALNDATREADRLAGR